MPNPFDDLVPTPRKQANPFDDLVPTPASAKQQASGEPLLGGQNATIGARKPIQGREFIPELAKVLTENRNNPLGLARELTGLGRGGPLPNMAAAKDAIRVGTLPLSVGLDKAIRPERLAGTVKGGMQATDPLSRTRMALHGFPLDPLPQKIARIGMETAILSAPIARGVGAVKRAANPSIEQAKILRMPTEQLIREAVADGSRASEILRVLRGRNVFGIKSPDRLRQVFSAVGEAGRPRRTIAGLLTSQRGSVKLPEPGDMVRFGKRVRRVISTDPTALKVTLAIEGGKTVTVPSSSVKPATVKQQIQESVSPEPEQITMTERQGLKKIIRREAAAAKEGFRAGAREQRQVALQNKRAALDKARVRFKENKAAALAKAKRGEMVGRNIRQELARLSKDLLPKKDQGRMLRMVATARTPKSFVRGVMRIEKAIATAERRQALADAKSAIRRVAQSVRVSATAKIKAKELLQGISTVKPGEKRLNKLSSRKEFVERIGEVNPVPKALMEELKLLEQKPIADFTTPEIKALARRVEHLEEAGKLEAKTRAQVAAIRKEKILDDITRSSAKALEQFSEPAIPTLKSAPIVERVPGSPELSKSQKFMNWFSRAYNKAAAVDKQLLPMDVYFDLLDGGANYSGWNYIHFKKAVDVKYSKHLNRQDGSINPIVALGKELGLNALNYERIAIHAYRVQVGGLQYLKNTGLTEQAVRALKLTEKENRWYVAAQKAIDSPFPEVQDIQRTVYGRTVDKIDRYWPAQFDYDSALYNNSLNTASGEPEIISDRLANELLGFRLKKNVEQGFVFSRTGSTRALKLNALDSFIDHMEKVSYFIELGPEIKMLEEVARSPRYQQAVGSFAQGETLRWLDVMARHGHAGQIKRLRALDVLRRNLGASTLGFKLSSILIQPTALLDGAAMIGGNYAFSGFNRVITDKRWREFLRDNFPEYRDRGADDPAYLDLSNNAVLTKWQQAGYWPLRQADLLTAGGVAAGAYQRALDRLGIALDFNNPVPEAIEEAQLMMRRTQASSMFKDLPPVISRGALTGNVSIDKALFQYQTFILGRWSLIRHEAWRYGVKEKDPVKAARVLGWLALATIVETGIRGGVRTSEALIAATATGGLVAGLAAAEEQFEKEKKEFVGRTLKEGAGVAPFMSQAISMGVYDSAPIPALQAPAKLASGLYRAAIAKTPRTRTKGLITAASGVGGVTGLPGISQGAALSKRTLPSATYKKPQEQTRSRTQSRPRVRPRPRTRPRPRARVQSRPRAQARPIVR